MMNCLFFSVFFTLFSVFSFGSLRYSQINRTFLTCYKGMFEASTVTVDSNGEPIYPYFDRMQITDYVKNYFKPNIEKYTEDYDLKVSYSKQVYGTSYYHAVTLKLTARINLLFEYEKEKTFTILRKS